MKKQNKNLVAYCGLYCGDCFAYSGVIADLAKNLRKELRKVRFERIAENVSQIPYFKVLTNYSTCYDVLGTIVKFRCKSTCRNGGGNPYCKIRKCCSSKQYFGCWECVDFEKCDILKELTPGHGNAIILNLWKIKNRGLENFLNGKKDWFR
jgi:hypothetical protein